MKEFLPTDTEEVYNLANMWVEPYVDLGLIEITTPLSDEEVERTTFKIENHPTDILSLPESRTVDDFNSITWARLKAYKRLQSIRLAIGSLKHAPKENSSHYMVNVKTSDQFTAGTFGGQVVVTVFGDKGETKFELGNPLSTSFRRAHSAKFSVAGGAVGKPQAITIDLIKKLEHGHHADWYVEYVSIRGEDMVEIFFPVFGWVAANKSLQVLEGCASLPQKDKNQIVIENRKIMIAQNRETYQWDPASMKSVLPGYAIDSEYNKMIPDEKLLVFKYLNIIKDTIHTTLNKHIGEARLHQGAFKNLDELHELYGNLKEVYLPPVHKTWTTDKEFGYQVLNGTHPVWFHRVDKIPANFPVTEELVQKSLRPKKCLAEEIAAGRVFILDFKVIDGIPVNKFGGLERFVYPVMCLLYVDADDDLVPIAIQCGQIPGPNTPIFTPHENPHDWLLAKMHVRSVDSQVCTLASHMLGTHKVLEPVLVSLQRNVSPKHPIYKILLPHFKGLMSANNIGRHILLADGGDVDMIFSLAGTSKVKLLEAAWAVFSWDSLNVPKDLEKRGVKNIPHYYYRDDGLQMWIAIKKFVSGILNIYYKSDQDVKEDIELKNFHAELYETGLKKLRDFPTHFTHVDDIAEFLTSVIWTGAGLHSSLNYPVYEYFGYPPNSPQSVLLPAPTEKGLTTEADILAALPPVKNMAGQIALSYTVAHYSDTDVKIGDYPEKYFIEPEAQTLQAHFKDDLDRMSAAIKARNERLSKPYDWLLPEKVVTSPLI